MQTQEENLQEWRSKRDVIIKHLPRLYQLLKANEEHLDILLERKTEIREQHAEARQACDVAGKEGNSDASVKTERLASLSLADTKNDESIRRLRSIIVDQEQQIAGSETALESLNQQISQGEGIIDLRESSRAVMHDSFQGSLGHRCN